MVSHELEALRLRLVATVQRELEFLLLKKLHNGPASLSFDEGEICYIEDLADLQVFCPCRQSRPQYLQPHPMLNFLSPLIVHHCLWTSSLSFSDFLWVWFPSLPSLQRPCNTHYEVTQSSPGCPETALLSCPMSVCGGTFADGIPRGGIASVSTTATTQRINLPGLLTEERVEEACRALSSRKGLRLCAVPCTVSEGMLTGQRGPWTKEGLLGVALAEGWVGQSRQYKQDIAEEAMDSWALSASVMPARMLIYRTL